jgi:Holliday junction resolvase
MLNVAPGARQECVGCFACEPEEILAIEVGSRWTEELDLASEPVLVEMDL